MVKCNYFPAMQNWIFSIITPVISVTWSFRNHYNMLICSLINFSYYPLVKLWNKKLYFLVQASNCFTWEYYLTAIWALFLHFEHDYYLLAFKNMYISIHFFPWLSPTTTFCFIVYMSHKSKTNLNFFIQVNTIINLQQTNFWYSESQYTLDINTTF